MNSSTRRPYEVIEQRQDRWIVRQQDIHGRTVWVSSIGWFNHADAEKHANDLNALSDGTIPVGGKR